MVSYFIKLTEKTCMGANNSIYTIQGVEERAPELLGFTTLEDARRAAETFGGAILKATTETSVEELVGE